MAVATAIYIILYFCAPLIARIFQNDLRIIPVARVALLAFVINATAIVQTNRLMKRMQVKMITVSNALGLIISSVAAIWMAVEGMGVWALVWQTLILSAVNPSYSGPPATGLHSFAYHCDRLKAFSK